MDESTRNDSEETASLDENIRRIRRAIAMGYRDHVPVAAYRSRFRDAQQARSTHEPIWKMIKDYIAPFAGRFLGSSGDAAATEETLDFSHMTDSTPMGCALTGADGLHGSVTAQDRQWFNFYIGAYDTFADSFSSDARIWVRNAQDAVRDALTRSNFYTVIYLFYLELLLFGNALMLIARDDEEVVRFTVNTAGTFWWVGDSSGRVEQVFIRHAMHAKDIAAKYGYDNCPAAVRDALNNKAATRVFNVVECIQPWNYMGDSSAGNTMGFTYEAVYFLESGDDGDGIITKEGYRSKPFVASKWSDPGANLYSRTSPAIEALPDVLQLHKVVTDINDATAWLVDPAFVGRESLFRESRRVRPGQIFTTEGDPKSEVLVPVVPPNFNIQAATALRDSLRNDVAKRFYNDKFLLVQNRPRQITAAEVYALETERDSVLGPIISRIGDNALIPALDRTFDIVVNEWNMLDDPPEEIHNQQILPYFTGDVAESQRNRRTTSRVTATLNLIMQAAQVNPSSLQYVNVYEILRYADESGVLLEGVLKTQTEIEQLEQAAMQQQQQAAQQQEAAGMLQAANIAGNTSVDTGTLLGQLMAQGQS